MQDIILQISTILGVGEFDVYFIAMLLVVFIIFCILGINKIFEVLAGLVLGIAIFIVFQYLLLNPNLTVPTFIDQTVGKFIVGSSVYLIFVLSVLVPLNGGFNIKDPKNIAVKILYTLILAIILLTLYFALIVGLIEKSYIYNIDNAFNKILTVRQFWPNFSTTSKIYIFLKEHVPTITLLGVFFVIYIVTFNDIVMMMLKSLGDVLKKIGKGGDGGGGGGGGGGHSGGDDGGHGGGHGHY